ncbi:MAG: hypothetical protein DSZ21_01785 [Tenericutes bacterium]|nr:MAG: hypothetical protein DSZ21_01785 [Mycoplasmatota bacterium]
MRYSSSEALPIDSQLLYFKNEGFIRGALNRSFRTSQYEKELELLFKANKVDEKFKKGFLELFHRQRSFEEGPGVDPIERGFKNLNDISK